MKVIEGLRDQLIAAKAGNRALDCLIHEIVGGHRDWQGDTVLHDMNENIHISRDHQRENGYMLIDLGAERLFIRAPEYTFNVQDISKLISKSLSFCVAREVDTSRWAAIAMNDAGREVAFTKHDTSAALATCLLAVDLRMGGT